MSECSLHALRLDISSRHTRGMATFVLSSKLDVFADVDFRSFFFRSFFSRWSSDKSRRAHTPSQLPGRNLPRHLGAIKVYVARITQYIRDIFALILLSFVFFANRSKATAESLRFPISACARNIRVQIILLILFRASQRAPSAYYSKRKLRSR